LQDGSCSASDYVIICERELVLRTGNLSDLF
jgi:hypothetical protein